MHGRFYKTKNLSSLRGIKIFVVDFFFFIGASATKSWEKSRVFRYGLPEDILSKGQNNTGGGGGLRYRPHGLRGSKSPTNKRILIMLHVT